MTREEVKELLPVMQAFAEGKMIQDKIEGLTDCVDTDEINLEYKGQAIKHRIKPEPKYRPFKNQEECWQEMQKHQPFGYLTYKGDNSITCITKIYTANINKRLYFRLSRSSQSYDASNLFKCYNFADGEPFGIKEE